jgi:hypothetical protein
MATENTTSNPARRIPLLLDIEYRRSYARRGEKGKLKNISLTGAFLELPNNQNQLLSKDKLLITFTVSGRQRQIHATIIWTSEYGCGLRFSPANNRDVQIVDDLMYYVESSRNSQKSVLDTIFKNVS